MKSLSEICGRALSLQLYDDRCTLEYPSGGYPLKQREEDRQKLLKILVDCNLAKYLTKQEWDDFNKPILRKMDKDLYYRGRVHDEIHILFWIVRLQNRNILNGKLYKKYVALVMNSSLDVLCAKCKLRKTKDLEMKKNIYKIWCWRLKRPIHQPIDEIKNKILDTFGKEIKPALKKIKFTKGKNIDFRVAFCPLNKQYLYNSWFLSLLDFRTISYDYYDRRYPVFEWVLSDMSWEEAQQKAAKL